MNFLALGWLGITILLLFPSVLSNVITTIAGSSDVGSYTGDGSVATSATLNNPKGVAIDSSGNFYIADYDNYRIRKVTVSTGIITTIAGTGIATYSGDTGQGTSAALNLPHGVNLDSSGNVYVADSYNNRIRKVTLSTGIITTVAGSSTSGSYSGDNGQATSAKLNSPTGIAVDSTGISYYTYIPSTCKLSLL